MQKIERKDKSVPTTFLLPESDLLRLKSICALQNTSMAAVLRKFIEGYINNHSSILLSSFGDDDEKMGQANTTRG